MQASPRYRSRQAMVAAVAGCLTVSLAMATLPGLKLPDWLGVAVTIVGVPEVGATFEVRGKVEALIGKLDKGRYRYRLPTGLEVVSGTPEGDLTLEAGSAREIVLQVKVKSAAPDTSITLSVTSPLPAAELRKAIDRLYSDRPAEELDALRRHIEGLKGEQLLAGMASFSATDREGFGGQEEEAFLDWLSPASGQQIEFALLGARNEPPKAAGERPSGSAKDLFARNPKLAELFRNAGRDPKSIAANEETDDYSEAVRALKAGRYDQASAGFGKVRADEGAGGLYRFAAANGEALTLFLRGKPAEAETAWKKLCDEQGSEPLNRYAHFNRGESLRSRGEKDKAQAEFEKALELKKAFTIARRRLRRD